MSSMLTEHVMSSVAAILDPVECRQLEIDKSLNRGVNLTTMSRSQVNWWGIQHVNKGNY